MHSKTLEHGFPKYVRETNLSPPSVHLPSDIDQGECLALEAKFGTLQICSSLTFIIFIFSEKAGISNHKCHFDFPLAGGNLRVNGANLTMKQTLKACHCIASCLQVPIHSSVNMTRAKSLMRRYWLKTSIHFASMIFTLARHTHAPILTCSSIKRHVRTLSALNGRLIETVIDNMIRMER